MGEALAGRRPLRRHPRLRQGQAARPCLAVSRLRDPVLQRGRAVRAVRRRAGRRRRAGAGEPPGGDRHRVRGRRPLGLRRPCRAPRGDGRQGQGAAARPRRHGGQHVLDLPEPDRRLRPLPRPQVRPDPAGGVLPPPGRLRGGRPRRPRLLEPRGRRAGGAEAGGRGPPQGAAQEGRCGDRPRAGPDRRGTGRAQGPARDAGRRLGAARQPEQRLPRRDRIEARRRAVGPGGPRPPGPHRRGPPRPGPPHRLRRHAGLRLPGPLPGRPGRRRDVRPPGTGRRPHRCGFRQPERRGRRPPGRPPIRPLRARDGDAALAEDGRLRLRARRARGDLRGA